ncbi:MAG: DUF4296 domain-containing protein [Nonlabens sp.]
MKNSLIVLLLLFTACSHIELAPKPDDFYDTEKMAAILTDLYLIDGSLQTNRRAFLNTRTRPDSFIYRKHGIDSLTYAQNFNYYTDRTTEYLEVIEQVVKNVEVIQAGIKIDKDTIPSI